MQETMETEALPFEDWIDLPKKLHNVLQRTKELCNNDVQLKAFMASDAIESPLLFGIKAAGRDHSILVAVYKGRVDIRTGNSKSHPFVLSALPSQWKKFFAKTPTLPYQSYWGIRRMFGTTNGREGAEVLGDTVAFANFAHVWRRILEILHDTYAGETSADEEVEDEDEDCIVGRYVYITSPVWGKCKVFYEQSGEGDQEILFLHTAGSDGRQYHGVLNNKEMRKRCRMTSFDLPAHGRSFPYETYHPGSYTNTEDAYVGCIAALIKKLDLHKPIVCGASMAGHICLAVAARCDEVGAGGVVPLEASDHINAKRHWHDKSPYVNQSLFNAESVYGLMAPTAPLTNRQLIWHTYSAQAYGIFHGDLDFYFNGWDGRDRMAGIDTKKCPVYMFTGEYDFSNTPEMSQATAAKIPGAKYETMKGLGHFPATEKPKLFVEYLMKAIDHIQESRIFKGQASKVLISSDS